MPRRDVESSSVLPARAGIFRPGFVLVLAGLCVPAAGLPGLPGLPGIAGLAAQEVREGAGVYYIPGHVSADRFGEALAVLGPAARGPHPVEVARGKAGSSGERRPRTKPRVVWTPPSRKPIPGSAWTMAVIASATPSSTSG